MDGFPVSLHIHFNIFNMDDLRVTSLLEFLESFEVKEVQSQVAESDLKELLEVRAEGSKKDMVWIIGFLFGECETSIGKHIPVYSWHEFAMPSYYWRIEHTV